MHKRCAGLYQYRQDRLVATLTLQKTKRVNQNGNPF